MGTGSLVAGLGHTLRTPLNSVLGFSELLLEDAMGPLSESQRRYVELIHDAGRRQLGLIDNLVDLARLQTGNYTPDWSTCEVGVLVRETAMEFEPRAAAKDVALELDVEEGTGAIIADRARLRRVIANLLDNAVRLTDAGGAITVSVGSSERGVRVAVRDTGPGVPPAEHERIFDGSDDPAAMALRRERRSGTGLALASLLVRMHGGRIWVESTGVPGEGSTFVFEVPAEGPGDSR